MAKIISILLISFLGWKATGVDLLTIVTLATLTIDIYKEFLKLQKMIYNILKMKTAKR